MDKVVGECQHVFVKERQIQDATLVADEVVDELLLMNKKGVLCKFDLEKPTIM